MKTQQIVEPTVIDPEVVVAFHRRHGTEALARQAVRLVQDTFPELQSITLKADQDPEEAVEWITLEVAARLGPAELRTAYHEYVARWAREMPPEMRFLVRLGLRGV